MCQIQGFLSIMKFIIFFIFIPLVYSKSHRLMTTYIEINEQTIAGIPEIPAVTTLDGQQIDYYDSSNIMKMIPKKDWMKEFTSTELGREYTEIREGVQEIKDSIHVIMQRFNQSDGVHTYQRMFGCEWDDETGESHGFDQYGYDGQDFILLDLKENRYITPVIQGMPTVQEWNKDETQLLFLKIYYDPKCVDWLRKLLTLREEASRITVSLLQKNPSSPVVCHATGFYPSGVTITWLKNGVEHHEDWDLGELLPNEDETFQRTSSLRVYLDEWKNNQFSCVVEHQGKTIRKTDDEIKSNYRLPTLWTKQGFPSAASHLTKTYPRIHVLLCVMGVLIFAL